MKKKIKKFLLMGSDGTPGLYDEIWCDSKNMIQLSIALDNSGKGKETININLMFGRCEVFLKPKELDALVKVLDKFKDDLK